MPDGYQSNKDLPGFPQQVFICPSEPFTTTFAGLLNSRAVHLHGASLSCSIALQAKSTEQTFDKLQTFDQLLDLNIFVGLMRLGN